MAKVGVEIYLDMVVTLELDNELNDAELNTFAGRLSSVVSTGAVDAIQRSQNAKVSVTAVRSQPLYTVARRRIDYKKE